MQEKGEKAHKEALKAEIKIIDNPLTCGMINRDSKKILRVIRKIFWTWISTRWTRVLIKGGY